MGLAMHEQSCVGWGVAAPCHISSLLSKHPIERPFALSILACNSRDALLSLRMNIDELHLPQARSASTCPCCGAACFPGPTEAGGLTCSSTSTSCLKCAPDRGKDRIRSLHHHRASVEGTRKPDVAYCFMQKSLPAWFSLRSVKHVQKRCGASLSLS